MAIKIIGYGSFGANVNSSGDYCQSYTQQHSVTEYTCQNAVGDTVGVALCDDVTETTITCLVDTGTEIPKIGDSIGGITGVVTATTLTASNTAFQTYDVTVKSWSGITSYGS